MRYARNDPSSRTIQAYVDANPLRLMRTALSSPLDIMVKLFNVIFKPVVL